MRRPFTNLTLDERRVVAQMLQAKAPTAKIAQALGRDRSTITREIRRNWWHDVEVPQADGYWHMTAQMQANKRRQRRGKLVCDPELRAAVIAQLKEGWSPEQIAGRLKVEVLRPHRLCHETIYQYVYSADGQSQDLARYLPERRRKRKPRHARKPRSLVFPAIMSIHHRPAKVNDRSQFGHWEGDLMIFRREHGQANITTLVERKTRYVLIFRNNDPCDAIYFIIHGAVRLHRDDVDIFIVSDEESFGEMEVLSNEPRFVMATALEDVSALKISNEDFFDVLADNISIAQDILRLLVGRIKVLLENSRMSLVFWLKDD